MLKLIYYIILINNPAKNVLMENIGMLLPINVRALVHQNTLEIETKYFVKNVMILAKHVMEQKILIVKHVVQIITLKKIQQGIIHV